jgi:hypothetical protein
MKTYKNINFKKRDYDCTNIVACKANANPNTERYIVCSDSILTGLTKLYIQNDVIYYGYL